jgi:hypothetical protein
MLSIWHELEKTPLPVSNITTDFPRNVCKHIYTRGKKANSQCTTTVIGEGNYCYYHKKKRNNNNK